MQFSQHYITEISAIYCVGMTGIGKRLKSPDKINEYFFNFSGSFQIKKTLNLLKTICFRDQTSRFQTNIFLNIIYVESSLRDVVESLFFPGGRCIQ